MDIKFVIIVISLIVIGLIWRLFMNKDNHPPDDNYPMW